MTQVITGVAGFIGSHLAGRLVGEGHDVIGIDCFTDYYDPDRKRANIAPLVGHPRFRLEARDLATEPIGDLLEGATRVYHLAAQPGVRGSWGDGFATYVRNNIVATQNLLEGLRGSAAHVVFASSSSVYGELEGPATREDDHLRPVSPYGVTKLSSEQLVMAYRRTLAVDARCVRYFTVYGPRQRPDMAFSKFIRAALRDEPLDLYGDGDQTRDFTFVADAVTATILAGEVEPSGEPIFNVGGGSTASVNSVISTLADILGRPIRTRRLAPQAGDVRNTGADLTRAREVLGWAPATTLAAGLRTQVEWTTASG